MIDISTTWSSHDKPWNYKWKVDCPVGVLTRVKDALVLNDLRDPNSLLGAIDLFNNSNIYVPVLEYDAELKNKGIKIRYSRVTTEKEYSTIHRSLFSNVAQAVEDVGMSTEELYEDRKVEDVQKTIGFLSEAKEKIKGRKVDAEIMEHLEDHVEFCYLLVKNKSGLTVS